MKQGACQFVSHVAHLSRAAAAAAAATQMLTATQLVAPPLRFGYGAQLQAAAAWLVVTNHT
jgi:hypothetical protein